MQHLPSVVCCKWSLPCLDYLTSMTSLRHCNNVRMVRTRYSQVAAPCASTHTHTRMHTQPFNGLLFGTTRAGRYQKKHSPTHTHPYLLLDFFGARGDTGGRGTGSPSGRHPIRTNDAPTPTTPMFFTGQMPFLPPNQQHQSTAGVKRFLLGWSPLAFGESQRPLTRQ